jgi:RHS repeat-associated protein
LYLIDKSLPYGQVIAEYDSNGSLKCGYVYGLERISQRRGDAKHYYVADGQGSIRALTDTSGTITDTYFYTAFGEELAKTGKTKNEFRYVGEQWDPNAGFYYLRARWYDQSTGRFASVDPYAGDPQAPVSLHRYLYGNASPVSFWDPSGEATSLLEEETVVSIQDIIISSYLLYLMCEMGSSTKLAPEITEGGINYQIKRLANKSRVYFPVNLSKEAYSLLFVLAEKASPEDGDKYFLVAGGSNPGLDGGMKDQAVRLGCQVAGNNRTQHAEESILDYAEGRGTLMSIGVTQYPCSGGYPGHNCQALLDKNRVQYNNGLLVAVASEIKQAGNPWAQRRAVGVGFVKVKRTIISK